MRGLFLLSLSHNFMHAIFKRLIYNEMCKAMTPQYYIFIFTYLYNFMWKILREIENKSKGMSVAIETSSLVPSVHSFVFTEKK